MSRPILRSLGLLLAVLLTGCGAMSAPTMPQLDGTAWVLSALPGRTLIPESETTLGFAEGRAQGSDGCNRFTLPYSSSDGAIEVSGAGPMTRRACAPDLMKQGESFIAALTGARRYRISGDQLQLLDANSKALAMFVSQSQSLAGTSWQVTGINNGRNALVSTQTGSKVTMVFAADGRVAGSAGCNQYSALYQSEAGRFRFVSPAATRRMCADPKLMDQERAFLKALEASTVLRIEGGRLEFRDAGGALQVTASREG